MGEGVVDGAGCENARGVGLKRWVRGGSGW